MLKRSQTLMVVNELDQSVLFDDVSRGARPDR